MQALKWLDHYYPETKDAVRWLNATVSGLQSEPLPVPSSSVSDEVPLDDQLQKMWSFTNPAILEGLVEKTNDEDLIERMKKYNEHFKYVRRSIPISNQKIILEPVDLYKPCLILIFKNITYFDDIDLFLREVFDIYRRYLRVHKIEPGCVKVTLQFDVSMEPFLQDCINKKREAVKHYAEMRILSIAGICIPSRNTTSACQCMHITRNHRPTKYTKTERPRSQSFSEAQLQVYPRTKHFKCTKSTRSLPTRLCKK